MPPRVASGHGDSPLGQDNAPEVHDSRGTLQDDSTAIDTRHAKRRRT